MQTQAIDRYEKAQRRPWNKGKLTGAKPPLQIKNVWSIRTKLQVEGRVRDLAMFNLAIDSKFRDCDVVDPRPAAPHAPNERPHTWMHERSPPDRRKPLLTLK
jgi:hypothetical protein